jgi:hypothetical protein
MSDFEKEKFYPSTESLAILRNAAIFNFACGLVLALLQFFGRMRIIGLIAGGIICLVGIGWLLANNPANKKTGALMIGVGILLVLSRTGIYLIMVVTQTLLNITTIGFLAQGVRSLIKYFMAQNKRV